MSNKLRSTRKAGASRGLVQSTLQTSKAMSKANPLAPTSMSPTNAKQANTSLASDDTGSRSAMEEPNTAGERNEDLPITMLTLQNALQNELGRLRETLAADIKGQTADIQRQMQSMRDEIKGDLAVLQQKSQADIRALREEISTQMKTLTDGHKELVTTQREMEISLTDVGDKVSTLEKANITLQKDLKRLTEKCNDLESRSRRQNIRIVGIEENSEKGNPIRFVTELLMQILGRENFPTPLLIDRAHRSLGPRPGPGQRPRHLLAHLHYYADKEKVLRLSREKGQLLYNGSTVHIFPDMAPEVARLRASFRQVKSKLRTAGITYSLYYPAKLEIKAQGNRQVFTDPLEAEKFLQNIIPVNEGT